MDVKDFCAACRVICCWLNREIAFTMSRSCKPDRVLAYCRSRSSPALSSVSSSFRREPTSARTDSTLS
ncbi:hypothetical protein D3C72_2551860 [compost metagenome]